MNIVILKNGQKHGPFSEEDVIKFLKSGRLILSDLGWREGLAGWTPLSQLLGPAAAHIPPPPPGSASVTQPPSSSYSNAEILRIAGFQKILIWVVVASLASILNLYVAIVIAVLTAVFLFQLARALRQPAWLFAIGAFIPLISVILLLALNSDATAALRKRGIRVGLLGANKGDLNRLKEPQAAIA